VSTRSSRTESCSPADVAASAPRPAEAGATPGRLVSVVVPTHNAGDSIVACLRTLVGQSHADLEILVCDDASTDDTLARVATVADPRIRILDGEGNRGVSAARNRGIRGASGDIVFFLDDDVEADPNWIERGLRRFEDDAVVGVEGKIVYVAPSYVPRYSDRVVQNLEGGEYMTANAAYRRASLERVGLFDESLLRYQDRDLALRVRSLGKIAFAADAVVVHRRERYDVRTFMREASKVGLWLDFEKLHYEGIERAGPIIRPGHLLTILLPPLILTKLLSSRRPDRRDALLMLLIYPRLLFERYTIWRWALRNRTLAI
jgi:glycosyltransferase involved in cell wall biosynthesis